MKKIVHQINLMISNCIFSIKEKFFQDDLKTTKYTFLLFFLGIIIYVFYRLLIFFICKNPLPISIFNFFSSWISLIGMLLAFLVMLKINLKKTETGKDFISLLTYEISKLSKDNEITILSPNMNIGSYKNNKDNLSLIALMKALQKGVKVSFITLKIDKDQLDKAKDIQDKDEKLEFMKNAEGQLSFIYNRYINSQNERGSSDDITPEEIFDITIKTLYDIMIKETVTIRDYPGGTNIVSFFTKKIFYIGQFSDNIYPNEDIEVKGELIKTEEGVKLFSQLINDKFLA